MPRDDYMLTAEELREKKARRRRLLLILGLALVLAVGIFFSSRPARNAIKAWQARRHAAKAFTLIEQEKWSDARAEAAAAFQLRPSEPQALRAVARFLSRTRQPQALEFWDELAKLQRLTGEDRREETAIALVSGETARAARTIEPLLSEGAQNSAPDDWMLAAQVRLQEGTADKALAAVEKALSHPAATRPDQLQATLLRAQIAATGAGDTEAIRKIQSDTLDRLAHFAAGDDKVAMNALVLLAQRALGGTGALSSHQKIADKAEVNAESAVPDSPSPIPPENLISRLEHHPLSGVAQKLLAVDLQIQRRPAEQEALITAALERWKNADADSLAVLATWLNGRHEFERTLREIPLEKALGARALFLQHVDALGALGRWAEVKQLLNSERYPLDPSVQHMYLARCSAQLGEKVAAENNWQRALEAAGSDLQKLLPLADYAEKNDANAIAASAYDAAVAVAPNLRPAQQGRLRLAQAARDTRRMHAILADMLRRWPNDTAVQNDEAYTRLLLLSGAELKADTLKTDAGASSQLAEIEALAADLVKREPASLPHRTLLALARLKQNRPAEALEVYADIRTPTNVLTPSALAVHAAVLAAAGQREDARTEVEHIPENRLVAEEKALITDL